MVTKYMVSIRLCAKKATIQKALSKLFICSPFLGKMAFQSVMAKVTQLLEKSWLSKPFSKIGEY